MKNYDHVEFHLFLVWLLVQPESVPDLAVELGKLNMMTDICGDTQVHKFFVFLISSLSLKVTCSSVGNLGAGSYQDQTHCYMIVV